MTMRDGSNSIAVVTGTEGQDVQALLAGVAADGRSAGISVVGVIAEEHGLPKRTCSAGILRDIVSGSLCSIYLESTPIGTSCHLDAQGVEAACSLVLEQLEGSDLVVLSKFGKLEATRKGLFVAFEAALAAGKPILTAVSGKHLEALRAFAPHAVFIEADAAALREWWRSRVDLPLQKAEH
jgi:hypothetical protein